MSVTLFSTKTGSVYTVGEQTYASWIDCTNDNPFGTVCEKVSAESLNSFVEKIPGLAFAAMFFTLGLIIALSRKLKTRLREMESTNVTRRAERQARIESANQAKEAQIKLEKEDFERDNAGAFGQQNGSLRSMRSGTTALIISGVICGLIAALVYVNAVSGYSFDVEKRLANIGAAGAWGGISQWLLAIGILGKLLIGAAKIIVEGLKGNLRQ